MTRFVFITGGVVSSLGKGLAAAALGALLQLRGYRVRLRKFDPYLNVDPGTMSPYQHGEVFVTEDGAETDLDLGHYERFTGVYARGSDSTTSGKIYSRVLERERRGDYLGGTVQVIPHVTDAIKEFIQGDTDDADIVICEIGGTIGDIEGLPFLEAIRQVGWELGPERTCFIHVTLVPFLASAKELKTKPTQHSVRELRALGIQPDVLVCRSEHPIPQDARRKIAMQCSVRPEAVIAAMDARSIYEVPIAYHQEGLDVQVLKALRLPYEQEPDVDTWKTIVQAIERPEGEVTIGIVGKYAGMADAYKSLGESLIHGGIANRVKVNLRWIEAEQVGGAYGHHALDGCSAVLVPGGFGERGVDGKIAAINYARTQKLPFLGICFGMQLACIEVARHVAGINGASSTEFGPCADPIVGLLTEWERQGRVERRVAGGALGGTMRLGGYAAHLVEDSLVHKIYGAPVVSERHRHRYEVNVDYRDPLERAGLIFTGLSPDGVLPEIVEIPDHPWFVGVQFHPEFKSRPFAPHPLFASFIEAAVKQSRLV
ncbi:MAG TPA: CTP synthase [Geminicoccus sp.]|jgi:CTP synthase|uniref:CTP synthase n=1 Tax=Geminicoccus sp. TaxID=2024832 RepID=UPI002E2FBA45|nr:CTP synthase [Geminicoccus sp.]HEX2527683.1 CTP synthase [Geminicoccus sp.]